MAVRLNLGDSKKLFWGRGGRSGVILPLFDSDNDADRLNCTGSPAAAYDGTVDSLMLRLCF
jgi:hypothetical protein